MAKKKDFSFSTDEGVAQNREAVSRLLKKKDPARQSDLDQLPTRSQLMEPAPGQISMFEEEPKQIRKTTDLRPARRLPEKAEYRTVRKQLLVSPRVHEIALERATAAGKSFNSYLFELLETAAETEINEIRRKRFTNKTRRLIAVLTPSLFNDADRKAEELEMSFNDFVSYVLENAEEFEALRGETDNDL